MSLRRGGAELQGLWADKWRWSLLATEAVMAICVWLLLPLALGAPSVLSEAGENAAREQRTPSGFHWTVELGPGTLEVEAPIAVVESIIPLPLVLTSRGRSDSLQVDVCESWDCLLPKRISVPAEGSVEVDAIFVGRAPRLKVVGESTRDCCDRSLAFGRSVAFAGPAVRSFAFSSATGLDHVGGTAVFPVDAGTWFERRPDLLDGFGAVLFDDGAVAARLQQPLRRFVARGGALSMLEADARGLGLLPDDVVVEALSLSKPRVGPQLVNGQLVIRLEDRMVRLNAPLDRVAHVGGGVIILRAPGRSEEEKLGQVVLEVSEFSELMVQLDPRQLPIVNVASAGLAPERQGAAGFAVVVVAFIGIGLALWRGLRLGPVVAARRTLLVAVVAAGALVGLRLLLTEGAEVKLAQFGPGEGGRRVVAALARAPGSFGEVSLDAATGRFAGTPSAAMVVGQSSWRTRMQQHDGRVSAALSSSSGLLGLWFGSDDTPGALRIVSKDHYENTLPWAMDWVLLSSAGSYQRELQVVKDIAPGARFSSDEAKAVSQFGTPLQERFARDVANNCRCAVGIATIDGVLTAIEVSR